MQPDLTKFVAALPERKRRIWLGAYGALAKGGRTIKQACDIRPGDVIDNDDDYTPTRVTRVDILESGQSLDLWCGPVRWYRRDPDDPVCVLLSTD